MWCVIRAIPTRWVRFVSCSQDGQNVNVTPPFSHFQPPDPKSKKGTRSRRQDFAVTTGRDPRDHLFRCPGARDPEGVFSRSFSLHSLTTRRAQLGAPAGELKMSLRTDATRLFERLAGRKEARKAAPEHHDPRTKPCDALDLGGVAAEQPTLEAMRASGRFWPRRGCSREISLPSGTTRATAAASRHGPDNDRGPCSADLKPQMWSAPSQLPAIRCFCGDGFAAA
jgi:hypothetical protein